MPKTDESEARSKQTTVEEGTEFRGTLHSTCQVIVRGIVDGDLTAPSVIVSETGTVVGNVKAECIRSQGVLAGHVDADDVYLSGSVRSDTVIRARTLEVKLQAHKDKLEVTFGECVLEIGDDPKAEVSDTKPTQGVASKAAPRTLRPVASAGDLESKASEGGKPNGSLDEREESGSKHRSVPPPPD
jgi:cytoskeletal protein CcmA (bactofilin family)